MKQLILITGGSSGIGLALAKLYFEQGNSVFILARDPARLANALDTIEAKRVSTEQVLGALSVDVSDYALLKAQLDDFVSAHGLPDLLINSAGVSRPGYVEELEPEVYRWTMDINYHGTVNTIACLLPGFLSRGSGHIVNFSSLAGVLGVFGYTAYSGSKFAVRGYTDALRAELKPREIRVSIVYPPDTDTPQLAWENQFKPFETREIAGSDKPLPVLDVAQAVLRGVQRGKYVIVPGFEAKAIYFLATHLGNAIYPVMDMLVRGAIRKKAKQTPKVE